MHIIQTQAVTLTNFEVQTHLDRLAVQNTSHSADCTLKSPNYEAVVRGLNEYLTTASASTSASRAQDDSTAVPPPPALPRYTDDYDPNTIRTLLVRLKPYGLAKAELMMILNLRPCSMGFLDCVVEESDLRFTAVQQEEILRIIGEVLGGEGVMQGMEREGDGNWEERVRNGVEAMNVEGKGFDCWDGVESEQL